MKTVSLLAITVVACMVWADMACAQTETHQFVLSSTTFQNGATLPLSMIYNYPVNGSNICSLNGNPGRDTSPELSWTNAPTRTRSFALIVFDVTAGVMHWGMYNISAATSELPENAGVAGSSYGQQAPNVFGDLSYDGPCPPADVAPFAHHYVFTLYALDIDLTLPGSKNFPPSALILFRALIAAGTYHHVLGTTQISGFYSTTPPSQ